MLPRFSPLHRFSSSPSGLLAVQGSTRQPWPVHAPRQGVSSKNEPVLMCHVFAFPPAGLMMRLERVANVLGRNAGRAALQVKLLCTAPRRGVSRRYNRAERGAH